jgi:hypothetical protein
LGPVSGGTRTGGDQGSWPWRRWLTALLACWLLHWAAPAGPARAGVDAPTATLQPARLELAEDPDDEEAAPAAAALRRPSTGPSAPDVDARARAVPRPVSATSRLRGSAAARAPPGRALDAA